MSHPAVLQWLLIGGGLLTAGVFMLALRFALREGRRCEPTDPLPPARLVAGANLGRSALVRGRARSRMLHGFVLVQAGAVAVGITAVFFMFLCLAAMVAVALVGG